MPVTKLTKRAVDAIGPADKPFIVFDADLKGFGLRVLPSGARSWVVEYRPGEGGRAVAKKRLSIGSVAALTPEQARKRATEVLACVRLGGDPLAERAALRGAVTLRDAWARYLESHLQRKERSAKSISGMRDHIERLLADWLDKGLAELGHHPARVAERHEKITRENGPYIANATMRSLRAVYNHARKTDPTLPANNPVLGVDWNPEQRRQSGMGTEDLRAWFEELAKVANPIRREFHLFTLLSGSRPDALSKARIEHLDLRWRTLHLPSPKGGRTRAFDIPLSRPMVRCLVRAIRAGRLAYPVQAREWIFPASSASGHLEEHKERRATLSKWGNDLRQTYRTLAHAAGVNELDVRLLMNHTLPGVSAGYLTKGKLLSHLREQQERISDLIVGADVDYPRPLKITGTPRAS